MCEEDKTFKLNQKPSSPGQYAITTLAKLNQKPREIQLQRPIKRLKRHKQVMKHGTSNSYDSPKESLIPSHIFSRSVRPSYEEGVQEVEELKSTTDLR